MDYRDFFEKAVSAAYRKYPFSDDSAIVKSVRERAKGMSRNNERKSRAFGIAAGLAGTAAVLAGAVFGLNWLNEHGGLKERTDIGTGAGYSANDTAASAEEQEVSEYISIEDLAGRKFEFSDLTVKIQSAQYDGKYLRLDYEGISADPGMRGNFVLESTVYGYFSSSEHDFARYRRDGEGENDRESDNVTLIMEVPQGNYQYMYFVPAYYKGENETERKDDIRVCARAALPDPAYLALGGDQTAMFPTVRMRVSPLVLKTIFRPNTEMSYTEMCDSLPSITAVYPDGTTAELEAGLPKPEDISGEQWWRVLYVPVSPDAPSLSTAEKVIMDGEEIPLKGLHGAELKEMISYGIGKKPASHDILSPGVRSAGDRTMNAIGG